MAISVGIVLGYAIADAVNPCALAVLTMILIAILTNNPEKRKKVLYGGIAFTVAIYIMYFFYGLIIIQFFRTITDILSSASLYIYGTLGIVAIILGILNIRDYVKYKPGSTGTEMPMSLRPKVKKLINTATSTKGAFVIGLFVTLFLLPCTIGPYVLTGGILAQLTFLETIPWLILYNIIFVLPMLAITVAIYIGYTTVEATSEWKELNIKKLHLMAGIVMLLLGIYILWAAIAGAV